MVLAISAIESTTGLEVGDCSLLGYFFLSVNNVAKDGSNGNISRTVWSLVSSLC